MDWEGEEEDKQGEGTFSLACFIIFIGQSSVGTNQRSADTHWMWRTNAALHFLYPQINPSSSLSLWHYFNPWATIEGTLSWFIQHEGIWKGSIYCNFPTEAKTLRCEVLFSGCSVVSDWNYSIFISRSILLSWICRCQFSSKAFKSALILCFLSTFKAIFMVIKGIFSTCKYRDYVIFFLLLLSS